MPNVNQPELYVSATEIVTEQEWLSYCKHTPETTFFHTPYWASVFCKVNHGMIPRCHRLTFNDGVQVLLPTVVEVQLNGLFQRNLSMVAGTFGGFMADPKATTAHLQTGLHSIFKKGNWIVRENPYDSRMHEVNISGTSDDFTQSVYLKDGYDAVLASSDPSHRNKLRQSLRSGVVAQITENRDDWDDYYKLYEHSIKRWKRRGLSSRGLYTKTFFQELYNLDISLRKLWIAKKENEIIAGIVCFYWNNHVVVWHGSGSEKHFKIRPNNLLYDRAIHDACNQGFTWFDCNPSGGYNGVIQFKKHLGAQVKKARIFERQSITLRCLRYLKNLKKNEPASV